MTAKPDYYKRGDCYRYAWNRAMDEDGGFVVHGTIPNECWGEIEHAWYERDGLVYDYQRHGRRLPGHRAILGAAMKEGIPRDEYPGTEHMRYTPEEVAKLLLQHRHFGPY